MTTPTAVSLVSGGPVHDFRSDPHLLVSSKEGLADTYTERLLWQVRSVLPFPASLQMVASGSTPGQLVALEEAMRVRRDFLDRSSMTWGSPLWGHTPMDTVLPLLVAMVKDAHLATDRDSAALSQVVRFGRSLGVHVLAAQSHDAGESLPLLQNNCAQLTLEKNHHASYRSTQGEVDFSWR